MKYLFEFLVFTILQSLFINGIRETFNEGMIFYRVKLFIDKHVNEFWRKPLYSCVRCMSGLYGALTFFPLVIYLFGFRWEEILVFIFDVGILIYLNYFFYKRQ